MEAEIRLYVKEATFCLVVPRTRVHDRDRGVATLLTGTGHAKNKYFPFVVARHGAARRARRGAAGAAAVDFYE